MTIPPPSLLEARSSIRLPLYSSKVVAGFPSPADDHMERALDLNEELIRNKTATFFARAQGDSMRDAGINDRAILIIDKAATPTDGKIVVALLDGQFTVKRLHKRSGRIFLVPANPDYNPIEVGEDQDFEIWGIVTAVINQFS